MCSAAATVFARGRVDHGDAGAGRSIQVDVVHPDSGTGDHLQVLSGLDNLPIHLGFTADDQGLIATYSLEQFGGLHAGLDVYVGPRFQKGNTLGTNGV